MAVCRRAMTAAFSRGKEAQRSVSGLLSAKVVGCLLPSAAAQLATERPLYRGATVQAESRDFITAIARGQICLFASLAIPI